MSTKEKINNFRISRGVTQAELGAIAGVGSKAVSAWEQGRALPSSAALIRICNHYGVKPEDLTDFESSIMRERVQAYYAYKKTNKGVQIIQEPPIEKEKLEQINGEYANCSNYEAIVRSLADLDEQELLTVLLLVQSLKKFKK